MNSYTSNLLKHIRGNVLYIRFNIIFYYSDDDVLTVTIPKINLECKGSFLISTLSAYTNAAISPLLSDVTLVIVKNDEADLLHYIDKWNSAYVVSTYHNNLNLESNIKLHQSFEEYGRKFEIFNHSFPYAVNNTFYIHTYILNIYTALQFIRNKNQLLIDSAKDSIVFTRSQNVASNVYVIQIRNKEFILNHKTDSILISPLFNTKFDGEGNMVHPFDVRNPNKEQMIDDVYSCEFGELKESKVYYMLYLYDETNLHDYVTLEGYITAAYNLSLTYNVTMVYIYIIINININLI